MRTHAIRFSKDAQAPRARSIRVSVAFFALVILVGGCRNGERLRNQSARGPTMGAAVPTLDLRDLGGQPADLSDFAGRVVVLNLWATWCVPCRDEMPELEQLQSAHAPEVLTVVGISVDDGGAALVSGFLEEFGITYPNFMADGGALLETLNLDPGVPHTLLLDGAGLVRGYWRGRFQPFEPDTQSLIEKIVAESD